MLALFFWVIPAQAYPWMIQHDYTGCATCHIDPSGGFLLTAYGRAQTQTLLSTFGHGPPGDEVDRRSEFGFGLVRLPPWLILGATVRDAYYWTKEVSPVNAAATSQNLLMQADLRAAVTQDRFVATGSLGYLHNGHYADQITPGDRDVLVSREFWVGYHLGEDQQTLIRAGRMYLPFGLRVIEHTFDVRKMTGTDIDSQQQYGASIFHEGENYHAELMAIAGNYQIHPDNYRQRGYAGYAEFSLRPRLQFGISSLITYQKLDPDLLQSAVHGAHGVTLRWSPAPNTVVLAEADILHSLISGSINHVGYAGVAQLDYEFLRGLHGMGTIEFYLPPQERALWSNREWLSAAWFTFPHLDLRLDGIFASEAFVPTLRTNTLAMLAQVHVSL